MSKAQQAHLVSQWYRQNELHPQPPVVLPCRSTRFSFSEACHCLISCLSMVLKPSVNRHWRRYAGVTVFGAHNADTTTAPYFAVDSSDCTSAAAAIIRLPFGWALSSRPASCDWGLPAFASLSMAGSVRSLAAKMLFEKCFKSRFLIGYRNGRWSLDHVDTARNAFESCVREIISPTRNPESPTPPTREEIDTRQLKGTTTPFSIE